MPAGIRRAVQSAAVRLGLSAVCVTAYLLSGLPCPFRYFLGVPCPCCGMLRAVMAAARFQFHEAFGHHPLFPLGVAVYAAYVFEELIPGKAKTPLLVGLALPLGIHWLGCLFA